MGSNTVRLDDDVYERIKSRKREDETFSDAVDRLTSEWTLLDFAAGDPPLDAESHRTLLDRSERAGTADSRERLERLDAASDE